MIYVDLKPILEARGISIRELSRMVDAHYEGVRRLVNNEASQLSRKLLTDICEALNVEISDILKHEK